MAQDHIMSRLLAEAPFGRGEREADPTAFSLVSLIVRGRASPIGWRTTLERPWQSVISGTWPRATTITR
jgi:hypothetical protein